MSRKKRRPTDWLTFFEDVGMHAFANPTDRYRDFNAVLLEGGATPEQCVRVLNEILSWCGMMASPALLQTRMNPDGSAIFDVSVEATFVRIGKQDIGRAIYDVLTRIPSEGPLPEQAQTEDPKET